MPKTEFNSEQFSSIYPVGIENHYWTLARNLIISRELEFIGAKGSVLEIGCGRGLVVSFLRQRGFNCYGIEMAEVVPDADVVKYIFTGTDFESLDKKILTDIEVVLLLDVIEHLEDDITFLKRILSSFPNVKHLIVTVPARQELWSNYDVFNGHFCRYDLAKINKVGNQAGWNVEGSRYFFHSLYLPAKISLSLFKKRQTKIHPPKGVLIFAHKILALLFVAEYYLLPKSLLGTSILSAMSVNSKKSHDI